MMPWSHKSVVVANWLRTDQLIHRDHVEQSDKFLRIVPEDVDLEAVLVNALEDLILKVVGVEWSRLQRSARVETGSAGQGHNAVTADAIPLRIRPQQASCRPTATPRVVVVGVGGQARNAAELRFVVRELAVAVAAVPSIREKVAETGLCQVRFRAQLRFAVGVAAELPRAPAPRVEPTDLGLEQHSLHLP
eukprot:CAMPEP_0115192272 /NCGR_PEP_ID=MMETSP0270-20121206/12956_1 /TAXON_ID=71861 /ORGANISM="Scrippsiella trochoidea, Strain CCMP3099" /LENGTH=190 /DNA_ID=CAMNT_0002605511 /DNA_START=243 /DNA_END=811 /DNA_ORIENTATION=-